MRSQSTIASKVDLLLPLDPLADAPPARRRPASKGGNAAVRGVIAGAALIAAAGCATHDTIATQQMKIEPVFSVTHSVPSAESSQAYFTLGKYFEGSRQWDRAIDAYRQALAADTRNFEACNALGVALAQTGRHAEAVAMLRQAVALAPDRAHLRNNLGYVLLLAGQPREAMAELQVAVGQDGTSAIAQANLRDAMARSGITSTPVAVATAAVVDKPEVPAPATSAPPLAAGDRAPYIVGADAPAPVPVAPEPAASARAATGGPARTELVLASAGLDASSRPLFALRDERSGAATAAAPSTPAPPPATTNALGGSRLEVSNGNGMTGMAAHVGLWLAARGVPTQRLTNQQPYAQRQTVIQFRRGQEDAARRLADLLPASAQTAPQASPDLRSDVRIVLGRDWVQIADCLARTSCRTAATGTASMASAAGTVIAQQ
jgi:tetratricopeptide (TPR) repeat protein